MPRAGIVGQRRERLDLTVRLRHPATLPNLGARVDVVDVTGPELPLERRGPIATTERPPRPLPCRPVLVAPLLDRPRARQHRHQVVTSVGQLLEEVDRVLAPEATADLQRDRKLDVDHDSALITLAVNWNPSAESSPAR